ncbi:serine/threonine protein kinase [Algisphaera agarilytica]|uniref:non-specific serine/threonine protein kinase n=1 Tax=Algisphaera agarilytica TaxID=1385975 RepID=A0A7X0HAW5_9BACT|nr:protein kinase [Algisphaera agarilytica]MBB6431020.1 serine/threonine-protein kinase [Algisphaera agarilytica]
MEQTQSNLDSTVGRLVVEKGLAAQQDVNRLLERVKQGSSIGGASGDSKQGSLASMLIAEGLVTQKQLDRLKPELEERRAGAQIPGYQIIRQLGAGAMARVFLAKQISLDRMVAIKVLPQKFTNNPDFVARFYAEGKAAAKLNHPNIVQAFDVGKSGDYHYFVMEFVDGRTVYDDITEQGVYSEEDAVRIGIECAKALDHAHKQGFIHRDVKPKNIMMANADNGSKLADMGLARAVSDVEAAEAEAGKAYGTPYYISPEQIRGEVDVDARADIYSLGATMYHMVTGQVPFDGANPSTVMHKHLKNALVPPDHLNKSLSSGISEVIEVCMAKDRSKRYASAADMLEDLQSIQRGEAPMQARKVFDVGALATLASTEEEQVNAIPEEDPLTALPEFWLALSGWVVAVMMFIALLLANAML